MSNQAQRVLDALMEFDATYGIGFPIVSIGEFLNDKTDIHLEEDYGALTADEEKQVIKAFLEFAY